MEVERDRDDRKPFDPGVYHRSARAQNRSVGGLLRVSRAAVALAREASPALFYIVLSLQIVSAVLLGLQVLLGKIAIERVLRVADDGTSIGSVVPVLGGLVAATVLAGVLTAGGSQLQRLLGERVQRLAWARILEVSASVRLETFESAEFFDSLQRVKTMAIQRPIQMAQGLFTLVGGLVAVIGLVIAVAALAPLLLALLLAGVVPQALLSRYSAGMEFRFSVAQTRRLRLRGYLALLLTGRDEAKEVRAFALGEPLKDRWRRNYEEYLVELRRHIGRRMRVAVAGAVIAGAVLLAALALLVWQVDQGTLTLAAAGAALIAVRLLVARLQQIATGLTSLFESALFLRDYEVFTSRPAEGSDRPTEAVPRSFETLEVEGIGFRYPETDRDVLRDVSLTLKRGEVIALIGENGSGKTTLAKILAGLFEPTAGRILWDGRDTAQLDAEDLRRHVGIVFQDFVRYLMTARENIGFGRHERIEDDAAIREAARRAGADDFLDRLPHGHDTVLGPEFQGYDVSGGQWQRIALARAFFRDAELLVLDEPTAALDARAEAALFEQVAQLAEGRTVLLISHRFSTVRQADRIVVIHEGEIEDIGSHDELMARAGRYAELFELQASPYR